MSGETLSSSQIDFANWMNQAKEGKGPFKPISKEKCEEIYALAYMLYQNQQYQEAGTFFSLLTEAYPSETKFWKGLGACLQMQKDYEEALNCYCCCAYFSSQHQLDPYLYVQTADCYFALKQIDAGLKALEAAHSTAKKMNDQRVLQHVAFMQQVWSKK